MALDVLHQLYDSEICRGAYADEATVMYAVGWIVEQARRPTCSGTFLTPYTKVPLSLLPALVPRSTPAAADRRPPAELGHAAQGRLFQPALVGARAC